MSKNKEDKGAKDASNKNKNKSEPKVYTVHIERRFIIEFIIGVLLFGGGLFLGWSGHSELIKMSVAQGAQIVQDLK